MARIALTLALGVLAAPLAQPATADVAEAVAVIAPAYETLAGRTAALAEAAARDCAPEALRPAYQDAWDAWARIDFLWLGAVERDGRGLAMAFWPDPKASGSKPTTARPRSRSTSAAP